MKNMIRQLLALIVISTLATGGVMAKKVKFMVNMSGLVKSSFGMHITGDFQTIAGYAGGDWNSASTPMVQEPGDTNLYSLVVDLPAMNKYEFKFVNGVQFYEVEFVPIESRVGYNFNDNRWIFIDSLAPDTMVVGPLRFAGNAPMGKYCARFVVDMQGLNIHSTGVHVAGDFQSWDPASMRLYSFGGSVYEYIGYVDSTAGGIEFKYINGNYWGIDEIVPGACATNGNRSQSMAKDSLLPTMCYSSCVACPTVAVVEPVVAGLQIFPNPTQGDATVKVVGIAGAWTLRVLDMQGRIVQSSAGEGEGHLQVARAALDAGFYCVRVTDVQGRSVTHKLLLQ